MTYLCQSCSCPLPPTFNLSLSIPNTNNTTPSVDPSDKTNSIRRNRGPDSNLDVNLPIHQSASAVTFKSPHLQPLSSLSLPLSTPFLTRSNSNTSFASVSTPTSSVFSAQTAASTPSETNPSQQSASPVDLNQLNTLLYQLASPSEFSPSTSSSSSLSSTSRADRRARFQSLLSTFHAATVCTLDESNTEELSTSLSELELNYPVAPNSVLQGIASSMTEPLHKTPISATSSQQLPSAENPGALILASKIAAPFQDAVREATKARKGAGLPAPKLVGILATPSPPSVAYAEWTKKACQDVGIEFEIWKTWEDSKDMSQGKDGNEKKDADLDLEADVEDLIIAANADKSVHGIMVYYPIFGGRQDTYLQQIVDPRKDVEGLHFSFCWNMYHNVRWANVRQLGGAPGTTSEVVSSTTSSAEAEQPPPGFAKSILPCTPLAIVKCLESMGVYDRSLPYGDRLYGKTITIFNRSEVVGRPLAALLANDGARVFSVDLDGIQEFNKRAGLGLAGKTSASAEATASAETSGRSRSEIVKKAHATNAASRLRPHHVVRKSLLPNPQACVAESQVVISGVPSPDFKVPTEWIKPGTFTVNFSSEKNFEKDVRTKAGAHLGAIGKTTIAMLQRNLLVSCRFRADDLLSD